MAGILRETIAELIRRENIDVVMMQGDLLVGGLHRSRAGLLLCHDD